MAQTVSISDRIDEIVVEAVFNEWEPVGYKCHSLNWLIQNGLDIIHPDDLKNWLAQAKEFERKYVELKKKTYEIVKTHLEKKNGKTRHTVRQDRQDG